MLKVTGIPISLDEEASCRGGQDFVDGPLVQQAARLLGIGQEAIAAVRVIRRSVDARRKSDIHFVVSAAVRLHDSAVEARLRKRGAAGYQGYVDLAIPVCVPAPSAVRPVVVGTGPAGLFAALYLARAGARPVVVERGARVDRRAKDVRSLNELGVLDTHSNVQFGEGGAGTFSDGKLTTNIKSMFASNVLHWFVQAGASPDILWQAKPHIGSDRLPSVVAAMRDEIIERDGDVLFDTRLSGVRFERGRLSEIELTAHADGAIRTLPCTHMILACGHSARDTFSMLHDAGVHLEQKPFSIGVRIEHRQADINRAQWGTLAQHPALGAADYKLAVHGCAGRSVYTFCMCPGGEVVCAASEEGGVVTNGASPLARDGAFANAALLVNVVPSDFGNSADPLAGVRFQRDIERRAFEMASAWGGGPYQVPAQTLASFLSRNARTPTEQNFEVANASLVSTSCRRGTVFGDLRSILPAFVCDALVEALPRFDGMLAGFASPDAVLLAPETRSTSPVRIARNETAQAWLEGASREEGCGIYPAGEGAGYAGGIMSAACDGLRVASCLAGQLGGFA